MRIIYFTAPVQDYLSDSILIGLKAMNNLVVDDYPNNHFIYKNDSFSKLKASLYGNGFTLYNHVNSSQRTDFTFRQIDFSAYDIFIFSAIEHQYGLFLQLKEYLKPNNTIIIDGSDSGNLFPNSGKFWKHLYSFFYPRIYKKFTYYKREINAETNDSRFYKILPGSFAKAMKTPIYVKPISFSFPSDKIVANKPIKTKTFATHIVDNEVATVLGNQQSYPFTEETDYYKDLQESKFGITTKRSGWDCLRHYEIAANGSVICFKNLHLKPIHCAPHGLIPGDNCISYSDYANLIAIISSLDENEYSQMQERSLQWVKTKTCESVASTIINETVSHQTLKLNQQL